MAADDDQMKAATVESRAYGSVAAAGLSDVESQEQPVDLTTRIGDARALYVDGDRGCNGNSSRC